MRLDDALAVVYLDQCVVSRFVKRPVDASWSEVHDLLRRGVKANRLVCPYSLEHAVETSGMPHESAIEVDAALRQLSGRWSLLQEPELIAAQIRQCIRHVEDDRAYALERTRRKPLSDPGEYAFLHRLKQRLDSRNNQEFAFPNGLNAGLRDGSRADRNVLQLFAQWQNESYARRFIADLEPSLVDGRPHVVPRPGPGLADYPSEFSYITKVLIEKHRFRVPELRSLAAQIVAQGVVFLPFFLAKVGLVACQQWKQMRRDHGDQYDVTRLSCALPVADVIVTDGSAASAIRDVRLDQFFGVQVFSTADAERPTLVAALKASLA